jgi:hypothetical protein
MRRVDQRDTMMVPSHAWPDARGRRQAAVTGVVNLAGVAMRRRECTLWRCRAFVSIHNIVKGAISN